MSIVRSFDVSVTLHLPSPNPNPSHDVDPAMPRRSALSALKEELERALAKCKDRDLLAERVRAMEESVAQYVCHSHSVLDRRPRFFRVFSSTLAFLFPYLAI